MKVHKKINALFYHYFLGWLFCLIPGFWKKQNKNYLYFKQQMELLDFEKRKFRYLERKLFSARHCMLLQEQVMAILSEQNLRQLNKLLVQQQQDFLANKKRLYNEFMLDCIYQYKQSNFYWSTNQNNHTQYIDLRQFEHLATKEQCEQIIGKIFGKSWAKKHLIQNALQIEFSVREDQKPYFITINAKNGALLEGARLFFEMFLAHKIYLKPVEDIKHTLLAAKQQFDHNCEMIGQDVLTNFLEYAPDYFPVEFVRLIGSAQFCFTERQNLLSHLKEVATIASNLAEGLDMDALLAKRYGFFHDLGKIPFLHLNGKNQIKDGVFIAQHFYLDDDIINIIHKHHDKKNRDDPYLLLVKAADVLSAARPGARNHNQTYYQQIDQKIRAVLDSLNWVHKYELLNWNNTIIIFAKSHVRHYFHIYRAQLIKALSYAELNRYEKMFDITINIIDEQYSERCEKLIQFQFNNRDENEDITDSESQSE